MPLIKRAVEPTDLSRTAIVGGLRNELECVTNNSLANVIRQLSSLSKHAEDMFGELYREATGFFDRTNKLQERVDRLKHKVTQLDSNVEEVSLQDINLRKPFKSSIIKDQQVIALNTRPQAIIDKYMQCDTPPPLSKLDRFREDGKESLKFYTDPTYFFELWRQEMQRDMENQKKEYRRKKGRRPKPQNPREAQKVRQIKTKKEEYQRMAQGKELTEQPSVDEVQRPENLEVMTSQGQALAQYPQEYYNGDYSSSPVYNGGIQSPGKSSRVNSIVTSPRPSQPPPAPPPDRFSSSLGNSMFNASRDSLPPPPSPPPDPPIGPGDLPLPPTPPPDSLSEVPSSMPPPPTPPPLEHINDLHATNVPPAPPPLPQTEKTNGFIPNGNPQPSNNSTPQRRADTGSTQPNAHSELLKAIIQGFPLRKIEERERREEKKANIGRLDVQAILEHFCEIRRNFLENDSDDEEQEQRESDDDGWESDD